MHRSPHVPVGPNCSHKAAALQAGLSFKLILDGAASLLQGISNRLRGSRRRTSTAAVVRQIVSIVQQVVSLMELPGLWYGTCAMNHVRTGMRRLPDRSLRSRSKFWLLIPSCSRAGRLRKILGPCEADLNCTAEALRTRSK